ncbi:MAG: DNA polymerase IV [Anaerolineae bacterium]
MAGANRSIIHIDMDAFYASVEELLNPSIAGKPILVGGDPQARGVVSSASYAARAFGVRSAMPMSQAIRLCPQAVICRGHHREYHRYSKQVMAILSEYTPLVEPLSIDEAFLDVTGCERLFGTGEEIARTLLRRIHQEAGLSASAGVAGNKLVAKIASGLHKPRGLVIVPPGEEAEFLAPLPVEDLWGIGPAVARRLHDLGVRTIGELAAIPVKTLSLAFGSYGEVLHQHALGRDNRPVVTGGRRRSLSHENTFARDITDEPELEKELLHIADEVGARLRKAGLQGRVVVLKLRNAAFETVTRNITLQRPTNLGPTIYAAARELLRRTWKPGTPVRLLGVGLSGLVDEPSYQLSLFGQDDSRWTRLSQALDQIRSRYGRDAIRRATFVQPPASDSVESVDAEA